MQRTGVIRWVPGVREPKSRQRQEQRSGFGRSIASQSSTPGGTKSMMQPDAIGTLFRKRSTRLTCHERRGNHRAGDCGRLRQPAFGQGAPIPRGNTGIPTRAPVPIDRAHNRRLSRLSEGSRIAENSRDRRNLGSDYCRDRASLASRLVPRTPELIRPARAQTGPDSLF